MSDNKMLYVAKDNAGGITAICDNPVTVENLRALIDDNVVTVPITGKAVEDYVFTIDTEADSRHFATSEAEVVDYITSMPELDFKKDSQFYGLPKDEAKEAIQAWLDDGHMVNEITEDLNNTVISEYMINTIYSQASPLLEGRDIDNVYKEMFGRNYHETAPKEMIQEVNESGLQLGEIYYDDPTYWTEAQKENRKIRVVLDSSEVNERLGTYTSPEENLKDVAKIFTDYIQEHITDINSLPHITEANLATKYLYKNLYEGSGDMFFVENYDTPWEDLNISKEEFIRQVDEDVERFNLQNVIEKQSYDCLYTCYSDLSVRFSLDIKGKEVDLNNEIELNQENNRGSSMNYYAVTQLNHGAEHKWIFDERTIIDSLGQNFDDFYIDCPWPTGGSSSSATRICKMNSDEEICNFLTAPGEGPGLEDPMLVDLAEYYCSVDVADTWCQDKSCTGEFVQKFGLVCEDTHDERYDEAKKMIQSLQKSGYTNFDYDDPFYGNDSEMGYSELCDLYEREVELRRSVDNWNKAFINLDKNPALTTRDIAKQIKGDITKGDIIDLTNLYKKGQHRAKIYQVLDMTNHRATAQLLSKGKFNEVYRTHSINQELLKNDQENQRTKTGLSR